ncbi:MAG: molybdopterin-dependent oxidoreductase, partial [Pseudomonadota bacterium]|nr:molybdopterin-dependent oxidoreductase [Pseudomonadota bacterium]
MKVDRRKFIQLGAWSGASLVLPDRLKLAEKRRKPWNEQSAKATRKHRNPRPTTCSLCDNHCGLITYREGDRVEMLLGNKEHPVAGGKLCAKAYGQLDRLYDPDRLLKPLRRVGSRGAGKWKEISWNEAYEVLTRKLSPVYADQGRNLAFINGQDELLTGPFLSLFPRVTLVEPDNQLFMQRFREKLYGRSVCFRNYRQCRYLLNFADDPFRSGDAFVTEVQSLVEGLNNNGLKMVTVASRLSQTGGKSEAWHPVHPRYYGDVAKAIAQVMVENQWYDKAAVSQAGINIEELKVHLKSFTPAAVSKQSGIAATVLDDIAKQLSHRQPTMVIFGDEVFQAENGWENACSIEMLNVLCGALSAGGSLKYDDPSAIAGTTSKYSADNSVASGWFFQKLKENNEAQVLISYQANPVFDTYDGKWPNTLLQDELQVSFYAAFDTHINETSQYADLILPMATELETWGLFSRRLNQHQQCLSLRQPVTRPVDEILLLRQAKVKKLQLFNPSLAPVESGREFNQVVLDLGRELIGNPVSGPFIHQNVESYIEALVAKIPTLVVSGGLNYLKKVGFFVFTDEGKKTQSVNLQLKDLGNTQPFSRESYTDTSFYLVPFAWHVLDSQTANSKYLAELRHENPVWIHPSRARKLGIEEGDKVKIRTNSGDKISHAWITEAIHPQCAAI